MSAPTARATRHTDPGADETLETKWSDEAKTGLGGKHHAALQRADAKLERGQAESRPILAIDEAGDREMERADAVKGDGGNDGARH